MLKLLGGDSQSLGKELEWMVKWGGKVYNMEFWNKMYGKMGWKGIIIVSWNEEVSEMREFG